MGEGPSLQTKIIHAWLWWRSGRHVDWANGTGVNHSQIPDLKLGFPKGSDDLDKGNQRRWSGNLEIDSSEYLWLTIILNLVLFPLQIFGSFLYKCLVVP